MITLGGIEFAGFELPEQMTGGGSQALVVHKMIGGKRVIHAMGPDDDAIPWTGRFMGETAHMRVLQLDLLRRSGRQVQLTYALRAYLVVISKFTWQMERPYLWSYSITCEVVQDQISGDGGKDSATLEQEVAADLLAAEAAAQGRDAILAAIAIASTAIRAAMGDPAARRGLAGLAFAAAQGALGDAIFEATGSAAAANLAVAAVAGVGGVVQGGDPKAMAMNFLGTVVAVEAATAAGSAAASLTRAGVNLQSAPTT